MVRDFQVQLKPEAFLAFGDRVAPGQSGRLDLKVRPGIDDFEYPYGIGDPLDLDHAALFETLRPVSPLGLEPLVPAPARAVFGGVGDRIVPSAHPRDLMEHWETTRAAWYQGAHITFPLHSQVRRLIDTTLRETLIEPQPA